MIEELEPVAARPANLTEIVFRRIRDGIVNQSIAPGSRVSESSLAAALQVSKTPVRESLLRLLHVGLVENTERGLRVVMPNVEITQAAFELRAGLEATSARLAAARVLPAEQLHIEREANASLLAAKGGDSERFRRHDEAFHTLVAHASKNELVRRAVGDALVLTSVLRARDFRVVGHNSVSCAQDHVRIAEAIASNEEASAAMLMDTHVQRVMGIVLNSMAKAS
ncbi:GntR family transcriptional regulator [Dactylosporangium sp. CS-033363]|uniref:GntR family transcriptional regulator n=1 Tax=Dactylosporangium sp. CS-033363 TaxID=3239935 RepID=UPI003D90B94D